MSWEPHALEFASHLQPGVMYAEKGGSRGLVYVPEGLSLGLSQGAQSAAKLAVSLTDMDHVVTCRRWMTIRLSLYHRGRTHMRSPSLHSCVATETLTRTLDAFQQEKPQHMMRLSRNAPVCDPGVMCDVFANVCGCLETYMGPIGVQFEATMSP